MADEPVSAAELASACGVDADALHRVLCLLADHGVFRRDGNGFSHTAASQLLRTDHPRSMRAFPQMMGQPLFLELFAHLEHSVRTGAPAIQAVEPQGMWAYYQSRPEEARIFGQAMTAKAAGDIGSVLSSYDFSRFGVIADIGGGRGHLLRAVLDAAPHAKGAVRPPRGDRAARLQPRAAHCAGRRPLRRPNASRRRLSADGSTPRLA